VLTQFGFEVRRWDASPSPNFEVSYSVDGGGSFSAASVFSAALAELLKGWTAAMRGFYSGEIFIHRDKFVEKPCTASAKINK
jgi:hypothetical protein